MISEEQYAGMLMTTKSLQRELENAKSDAKQSEADAIRALGERNDARHALQALRTVIESAAIGEHVPASILKAARS